MRETSFNSEGKHTQEALRKANEELEEKVEARTTEHIKVNVKLLGEIRKREAAEEKLRKSEMQLLEIIEDQAELICRFRPDGTLTFANDAYCRYFSKTRDEILESNYLPLIPVEDHDAVEKHLNSFTKNNPVATIEHRILLPSGDTRWYQWSNRAIFNADGNIKEFQSVGRDITHTMEAKLAKENYLKRLIESQEIERRRMGAELHDGLAQDILAIRNGIKHYLKLTPGQEDSKKPLEDVLAITAHCIEEVRTISYNLHPHMLEKLGFTKAVKSAVEKAFHPTNINFSANIDDVSGILPKDMEINLYRIIQEGLSNILKHSGADEVSVNLISRYKSIYIKISDNGKGIDNQFRMPVHAGSAGLGLTGISERTKILGGIFTIDSVLGKGTTLEIEVPHPAPARVVKQHS
ncbi:MAG: hypothetical protein IEMM0002_0325 [bacterium]|nr:MAG: hypothetical protein IEMM0002_0325 [bacterium]